MLIHDVLRHLPGIPNGFTTNAYFSRMHLEITETLVRGATTDDFTARDELCQRFGAEETAARVAFLHDVRPVLFQWATPGWNLVPRQNHP